MQQHDLQVEAIIIQPTTVTNVLSCCIVDECMFASGIGSCLTATAGTIALTVGTGLLGSAVNIPLACIPLACTCYGLTFLCGKSCITSLQKHNKMRANSSRVVNNCITVQESILMK